MEDVARRLASTIPAAGEVLVRLSGVSMKFGRMTALHPVDLSIQRGDFFALLGPSGCGKTTLLKTIGGFLTPSTGRIEIEGEDVTRLPPEMRRTGMVFQGYGLFPHMSVRQNIAYGLKVARRPKAEIDRRVEAMIALVRLEGMADRLPAALSGGQQQRVALARSLVMEPAVLLLDESLAALDLALRKAMQEELRSLHRSIGGTFVFVTHDQHEAMAMANRIAVMKDGRIVQQGTPQEIYDRPATMFVAEFIGSPPMNFLSFHAGLSRGAREILVQGARVAVPEVQEDVAPADMALAIRPEHIRFDDVSPLRGSVYGTEYLGTTQVVAVETADGMLKARIPADRTLKMGETVGLALNAARLSLFDRGSGRAIRTAQHGGSHG